MDVAIVGAGIAGLVLGRELAGAGHRPVVFDKGRGVGGRASTRRVDATPFDHGAQYFTARDPGFRALLDRPDLAGSWARWPGRFARFEGGRLEPEPRDEPWLVGVPGMSGLPRALAAGLDVRPGAKVEAIAGGPGRWTLSIEGGPAEGPFDWVVSTAPPAQTAALFERHGPIAGEAAAVRMLPCFALMIEGGEGSGLGPFDAVRCVDHPILGWAADNRSKPGRPADRPALVVHSSNAWADAHVGDDHPAVAGALRQAARADLGLETGPEWSESVHRWLYAKPERPLGRPFLIDRDARLAAAGDWCVAGKVEGAFLAAAALAGAWLGDAG